MNAIIERSAAEFGYPNALMWGDQFMAGIVTVQPCNIIYEEDEYREGRIYVSLQANQTGGADQFYTPDQLYEIGLIFLKAAVQQRKINSGELR